MAKEAKKTGSASALFRRLAGWGSHDEATDAGEAGKTISKLSTEQMRRMARINALLRTSQEASAKAFKAHKATVAVLEESAKLKSDAECEIAEARKFLSEIKAKKK